MAATAAAAIGSSFSTTMHTLKLSRSKHCPSDALLRIISTSIFKVPSISHSHVIDPPLPLPISHKWRAPRISAAVAQEEAAATAPVEEEQQQGQEEGEQVLREEGAESPVNTKLYFGNLPYSCDSAQLAGIIQNYGSPELVEVCIVLL